MHYRSDIIQELDRVTHASDEHYTHFDLTILDIRSLVGGGMRVRSAGRGETWIKMNSILFLSRNRLKSEALKTDFHGKIATLFKESSRSKVEFKKSGQILKSQFD